MHACATCFKRNDIWLSLVNVLSHESHPAFSTHLARGGFTRKQSRMLTLTSSRRPRHSRCFATAGASGTSQGGEGGSGNGNGHARHSRHPTHQARRETHPYPFPTHANPTPYEIFHLPVGAGQSAIKGRYYDLVRFHHPDAPHCRALNLTPQVARARFQAITAAYEALKRGQASSVSSASSSSGFRPRPRSDVYGRAHGYTHARSFNAEWAGVGSMGGMRMSTEEPGDDRWKDRMIIAVGLGAIAITLSPLFSLSVIPGSLAVNDSKHRSAAKNLAAARKEARTVRYGREKEEGGLPESDFCGGGGGGGGGSATN